ncbi:unnamed protein product [Urochloa decumbens]|uniref:Xylanase inhibitor C-terminal domain-containing protein n=1 Tax=Urochloa decumbens TaxID=240449 RepID=A0ABC9ARC3_9POAL
MASVAKLLLLVLCSYHTLGAHAAGGGRSLSYTVLSVASLNNSVCSDPKATPSSSSTGFTVPLHHRDGPCSPLTTKQKMPTLAEKLQRDKLRAASIIQRKFSAAAIGTGGGGAFQQSDAATVPTTLGASLDSLQYRHVVTRLPRTAYSALSSAFKAGMKKYRRAPASGGILDTCFNFKGQSSVSIPTVALVFSGGAVVNLDPNGVMLDNCLAFAGNSDDTELGIIGNVQQRTFEVLYNVGGGAVGFRAGAC